jgi:hypothetical protein
LNDGVVPWKRFDHPTYGPIEIGGHKKPWFRTPVSFLLEEECHRNSAFTLFHADQLPWLKLGDVSIDPLPGSQPNRLFRVWATVENHRMIPTRTQQDIRNHISAPDRVSLEGPNVRVISSGRVTDRYFKMVVPVERRPDRVELDAIGGMDRQIVQFIVSGRGRFEITVDSVKGGIVKSAGSLP